MNKHTRFGLLAAAAIVAAACGSDSATTATTATTVAAPEATAAPTTAAAVVTDPATPTSVAESSAPITATESGSDYSELVKYVGGQAGKASGEPITIGWVNQEGGIPSFGQATNGAKLALDVINNQLGGIGGRPLALEECFVISEEDGQKCGIQMANSEVPFVALGTLVIGDGSLYSVLKDAKPTIGGPADTNPDLVATNSFFYNAGAPGVVQAMAVHAINTYAPKKVALITVDNPAGQLVSQVIVGPALDAANIEHVDITITQGAASYATDVNIGADADVAIFFGNDLDCSLIAEAYAQTGIVQPVVTTFLCATDQVQTKLDTGLAEWTMVGLGAEPRVREVNLQVETYWSLVDAAGGKPEDYLGFAPQGFIDLMSIAKMMNAVGVDKVTSASMSEAAKNFAGPIFMGPPGLKCGGLPQFPAVCANTVSVTKYTKEGGWEQLGGAPMVPIDKA
jgi:branched-chain amino acid transport system substrate-binding protein